MKITVKLILLTLIAGAMITSTGCRKKGCTDVNATNYDSNAKKDDGTCTFPQAQIEKWIVGTWELDRYVQQDYKDGELVSESESVDQGKVQFKEDGTAEDIGGNFIGGEFEWSNSDTTLTLVTGAGTTIYDIEEYSESKFVFSLTDENGNDKFVERWYLSK